MEQKIEMNPPSKAMTGYKRAAYKPYTPANYIKPQQPTGTSYSLAYPTYSSMPSYNPVIANQSMKIFEKGLREKFFGKKGIVTNQNAELQRYFLLEKLKKDNELKQQIDLGA